MSSKAGGKLKPLKQPKADKKEYDEDDLAKLQKKKEEEEKDDLAKLQKKKEEEEKAPKEKTKAPQKGAFECIGSKKPGKAEKAKAAHKGTFGSYKWETY